MTTPAGWYPDPSRRFPHRYWDGQRWTDHVAGPQGQGMDPLPPAPQQTQQVQQTQPVHQAQPVQAQPAQRRTAGATPRRADPAAVFNEPTLALLRFDHGDITQLQYVTDDQQLVLDAVEEPKEQGDIDADSVDELTRKARTTTMRVVDTAGTVVARVAHVKPWKSDFTIMTEAGMPLLKGEQENVLGAPRLSFTDAGTGQQVAMIRAESAKARTWDVEAPDGSVVAKLQKIGSYDTDDLLREARANMPIKTVGQWLYDETIGELLNDEREILRFVLNRPQPVAWQPLAMVTLLSPLMIELSFSVL